MFHIAICDDDPNQLKLVRTAVEDFFARQGKWKTRIDAFDNALLLLEDLDKTGGWDIALLDICMPGIMGIDAAREIRRRKSRTELIFLTSSDEFAVDAFALQAAHYLLKPFTARQMDEALGRAVANFESKAPKHLTVRGEVGELRNVDIDAIQYVESQGHVQNIYLTEGTCTEARRSLSRLHEELEQLAPGQFIAPYKGYVVNQRAITTLNSKCILLRCGVEIPIPRGAFRELQAQYMQYRFPRGNHSGEVKP